jgi:hypothetical protein
MPVATKKKAVKKEKTLKLRVGNIVLTVEPVPAHEVALANARIQRRVAPVFHQIRKTRRAAAITASKIILNA